MHFLLCDMQFQLCDMHCQLCHMDFQMCYMHFRLRDIGRYGFANVRYASLLCQRDMLGPRPLRAQM